MLLRTDHKSVRGMISSRGDTDVESESLFLLCSLLCSDPLGSWYVVTAGGFVSAGNLGEARAWGCQVLWW
jgi:hypothetical protein